MLRSDIIGNVRILLQIRADSTDTIEESDIGVAVDNATRRYSLDRPRVRVKEYIGNGQDRYALPSDWDGFAYIDDIFFDIDPEAYDKNSYEIKADVDNTERAVSNISSGATSVTLSTVAEAGYFKQGDIFAIENNDVVVMTNYAAGNGNTATGTLALKTAAAASYSTTPKIYKIPYFRFIDSLPSSNEFFQVNYHIGHTVDDEAIATIPAKDQDAFEHLAAALTAYQISALYANTQSSTIPGDGIDYGSKASEWRAVAEAEMKLYNDHLGIGEDRKVEAGGAFMDIDAISQTGQDFFWKSKRYR